MDTKEREHINFCIKEINQKLNWKEYKLWTNSDYVNLSLKISEETGITISPHTLKRLCGKLAYKFDYNPQTASKNALAKFAGYRDWDDFLAKHKEAKTENPELITPEKKRNRTVISISAIVILITSGLFLYIVVSITGKSFLPRKSDFSFAFQDSAGTVPHSVKVIYDISHVKSDHVTVDFDFIHPVLGPQVKKLDRSNNQLNFTYQIPGIYNIHLIYRGKVLASKKVIALTNDWVSYFIPESNLNHLWMDNIIGSETGGRESINLSRQFLKSQGFDTNKIFDILHRIMKDFGIDGDNFRFRIRYRNSPETGGITCFDTGVRLHCVNNVNEIVLTESNCQQFSHITFGEISLTGEESDLSELTFNPDEFNELEIENCNKDVHLKLNDKVIYNLKYKNSNGNIMGIDCVFKGCGVVDFISLESTDWTNRFYQSFNEE
jgi:hypothetical protein